MRRLRPGTETPAEVHHEIPIPKSPGLTVERSSLAGEIGPWVDAPAVVVVLLTARRGGLEDVGKIVTTRT
jgi:hypothetical protein